MLSAEMRWLVRASAVEAQSADASQMGSCEHSVLARFTASHIHIDSEVYR